MAEWKSLQLECSLSTECKAEVLCNELHFAVQNLTFNSEFPVTKIPRSVKWAESLSWHPDGRICWKMKNPKTNSKHKYFIRFQDFEFCSIYFKVNK